MSQVIFDTINPSTTSGNELATILDDFKDAMVSGMSGVARPAEIDPAGMWIDTSDDGNGIWTAKIWDGTADISVFSVNKNTGTVSISAADSLFEVIKISDDSVGPILKLLKKRIADGGQTKVGDIVGQIDFKGTTELGVEALQAQIISTSLNDVTGTTAGSTLVFKTTLDGTASISETMRLEGGKLGLGIAVPLEVLHINGNFQSTRISDDAVGPEVILDKKRVSALGQVLTNDTLGKVSAYSVDDAGTSFQGSGIEVKAKETHTTIARGTQIALSTIATGETALEERIVIDKIINIPGELVVDTVTATTFTADTIDTTDVNVSLNKDGDQATADAGISGIEVQMTDAANFILGYDSTLASFVKAGELGSEKELVNVDSIQNVSNKTITASNINSSDINLGVASDTSKIVISKGTRVAIEALTRESGSVYYISDEQAYVGDDGTDLVDLGGGGGGGGSFVWELNGDTSPLEQTVSGMSMYSFDYQNESEIWAFIQVPASYKGDQIKLTGLSFTSAGSTDNVLFRAQTYLNRSGQALNYQNHISTNTELTLATANITNVVSEIDLCSVLGEINAVAVLPGDYLAIRLYRDVTNETINSTNYASMMKFSASVGFKG
tara:strand:- start:1124 stop:2965 length:1842 start_codon:yes stop_codon:yes gene_type:complete